MKKIFLILLLLLSPLIGNNLTKVKLQLQWKHQFEFAGFYAAKEKGFYKDAGLDVEFLEYKRDGNITDTVLNNNADFALTYSSLIAEYLNGKPVVLLANYFKQSPLVLISQPYIKTPKNLQGKKVMGVSDNIDSITLKLMLEKFGISQDDIINVPTNFTIQDFIDKKIDAMAVFTTNEIFYLDKLGIKYNIFNPSLYGHEYYDVNLFTSKKLALNNPTLVKKFKEASNKGWEYALKHKDEIVNLIIQKYNTQKKTKEALMFEAKQIEQIMFTKSEPIGSIDPLRLQLIAKNFVESGFAPPNQLYTFDKFIFLGDSYTPELTNEEKEYLQNNTIKIGMVRDYYPFSYIDNGKISGFSYEYFKLLASKVGLKHDIVIDNWSTTLERFKQKKLNIIDAISYTKQREPFTNFTSEYFQIPNVIFARKNAIPNYRGLQSLKNKKVGITKGIYYYDTIKNLNLFNLVPFESSREKIKALAHGKIDAAFNNLTSGQKYILQGGYSNLEVLDEISDAIVKKEDLRLGIEKENIILYSIIQKAMNLVTSTEKLQLIDKYFSATKKQEILQNNSEEKVKQSVNKIAESIAEYVWTYRIDLLINSLKRWLDFFGFEAAYFHDKELDEHLFIWRENNKLYHQQLTHKPDMKQYNQSKHLTTPVNKNSNHLGDLTIYFKNSYQNGKIQLSNEEKQYLNNKKQIKMCVDPDWEPYEVINENGEHVGLAADFIHLIEKKIGLKLSLVPTNSWNESLEFVRSGKCEVLSFLNETPDRKKYLNFTPSLYEEAEVIIAKNDVTYIDDLQNLENKKVGIVKGYKVDEYIKKDFPKIKVKYIKNYEDGIKLVSEGKIYATINSLLGTAHLIRKLNLIDIKIAGKTSLQNDYKIGITKEDKYLHSILSKAVQSIQNNEKEKILSNWIAVKFENKVDYTLVFYILMGGTLLFILFSYWNYKLQLENKKRIKAEDELKKLNLELEQRITKAIQENDKKEKILQQQARLAQMGEMISMIAHQWRQPLGSINSAAIAMNLKINIFQSDEKNHKEATELLKFLSNKINNISNYVLFLSTTIDDFRNFFRPDKQKESTSVETLINTSLDIVKSTLNTKKIKVITEFTQDTTLELYKNEMIQVILNIIKNSEDNFAEKQIKEPFIKLSTKIKDGNYIIEISDNGGGIDDSIIEKIFDPYFSTKDEKNGTGMGLYISKIIVEDHNKGKLSVSNTNDGACFIIELKA